jgi:signal recognition particle protein
MAVGYSHSPVVAALLEAGADPGVRDRQGRDVVALVASLRASTPLAPELMGRRFALEQAASLLSDALFEEVEPRAVLGDRPAAPGAGGREFLVAWPDGRPDAWVPARDVAADVVADYDAGLEYAAAASIRADRRKGSDGVEYLVRWADGGGGGEVAGGEAEGGQQQQQPLETWEPEENVEAGLVAAYEERVRARAAELAGKTAKKAAA